MLGCPFQNMHTIKKWHRGETWRMCQTLSEDRFRKLTAENPKTWTKKEWSQMTNRASQQVNSVEKNKHQQGVLLFTGGAVGKKRQRMRWSAEGLSRVVLKKFTDLRSAPARKTGMENRKRANKR